MQASYVSGEFDPTLQGRVDIDDYAQGADKLRNVYVRPQGGVFRREGLEYYAPIYNNDSARIIPFQFNDVQTYVLVLTPARMEVYRADDKTLQASLTSSPISNLTADILAEINWTQSADTLILFHKDLQPIKITRTSDTSWTALNITFSNIPPYAFSTTSTSSPADPITVDITTGQVNVVSAGTPFTSGSVGQFINTPKGGRIYITEYVSTSEVNGIVRIELEDQDSTAQVTTITPAATTGTGINFTASGSVFLASQVGQFIKTPGGGIAVITSYTSGTVVTCDIIKDMEAATPIENWSLVIGYSGWEYETGYEDVMSSSRGWPRSGTFHKSRLVLGGLGSRPQTILMSKIGDFFNFDIGESLDDEAIDVTIDDDQVNIIRNVFSGRGLNIFTSGGEFSIRSDLNTAITPSNIADQVQKETRHGSSILRPVSVDGAVVFVEREDPQTAGSGRIVRQFVFNETEQSFNAPNISIFSQHLVNDPVAMDIRRSTETHPANYLYMVNGDGTCAVLNSLREQDLLAWSLFETDGIFEDVCVSGNKAFFVVKRTIGGSEVRNLEVLNENNRMDCSLVQTSVAAKTAWSGLAHLNGQTVRVIGDDFMLEDEVVSGSSITSSEAVQTLEAGLSFLARVKHLPVRVIIEGQRWAGLFKNPVYANVRLYQSRDIVVKHSGQISKPSLQEFATEYTESDATLYTKWVKVYIGGINRDVQVEVTQEDPLDFNILAVHFGVRVT